MPFSIRRPHRLQNVAAEHFGLKRDLRENGRRLSSSPATIESDPEPDVAKLRSTVRYAESSVNSRFMFDCIAEHLRDVPKVLAHFVSGFEKRSNCNLDTMFAVAVLSQTYEPTALFHYLDYIELRFKELQVKTGDDWYKKFYLTEVLGNSAPLNQNGLGGQEWIWNLAYRNLIAVLREKFPIIALRYENELVDNFRIGNSSSSSPFRNRSLDGLVGEIIETVKTYPGSLNEWQTELREAVVETLLPALKIECLEKGDDLILKRTFARLSQPNEMCSEETIWAKSLCAALERSTGFTAYSRTAYIDFITKQYPEGPPNGEAPSLSPG